MRGSTSSFPRAVFRGLMRNRVFGVTTLDVVRASRFVGEIKDIDPKDVQVTVVGGHSGVTIVPLLSKIPHGKGIEGEQYKALIKRIQFGGDGQS